MMDATCLMIPGAVTDAWCATMIAAAERQGFDETGQGYPRDYRNNDRLVRDDPELAAWLFERMRSQLPGTPLGLNPRFRFCRYRDGQRFTVHRDGAWAPSLDQRTRLTVQVYLNDASEFCGGETRFTESGLSIAPKTGLAIVFDHRLWHEGCPVTRGTKYVLRSDVLYAYERPAIGASGSGVLRELDRFEGHLGYVWSASASAGVISGSRDGTVRRWPGGEVLLQTQSSVTCVECDGDGVVWAGTRAGDVYADGRRVYAHAGAVLSMVTRSDGTVATAGADGVVRNGARAVQLGGGWIWSLCERDGDLVAGCDDGTLRTRGGGAEAMPGPVHAVSPTCVGLADGRVLCRGEEIGRHGGIVTGLVELEGGLVASASEDCTVAVWSPDGRKLGEGRCDDFVRSVARDGQGLVTASYDGTVRRWAVDLERADPSGLLASGRALDAP